MTRKRTPDLPAIPTQQSEGDTPFLLYGTDNDMQDMANSVDKFLSFNEYKILEGKHGCPV